MRLVDSNGGQPEEYDEVIALLQLKKKECGRSKPSHKAVQADLESPAPERASATPDLDAEVSLMNALSLSDEADDDAATSRLPVNDDESTSPRRGHEDDEPFVPSAIILGSGAPCLFDRDGSSRAERLERLHATAKAPTDQMFSSAYARRLKKRADANREELARRRGAFSHSAGASSLARGSSPETVISQLSDYTAWSCPSPRSPSRLEFSHRPPPSFVPRIRLEALRSPRARDNPPLHHSPDPNKAAALYSPCSAFTPRSDCSGRHSDASTRATAKQAATKLRANKLPPHPEPEPTNADCE